MVVAGSIAVKRELMKTKNDSNWMELQALILMVTH